MVWREFFHISLARKCQLLFGMALILIIGAALFVPAYFMESFVHELNARRVRELALLARARVNPSAVDWLREQRLLEQWWDDNAKELGLPPDVRPRLIPLPPAGDLAPVQIVLKLPDNPPRWLLRTGRATSLVARAFVPVRVAMAGYRLLPPKIQDTLARPPRFLVPKARLIVADTMGYDPADTLLVNAIKKMQGDDGHNEESMTLDERPRAYRCVLGVRGVKEGLNRRPLVAVIDIKRTWAHNSDLLVLVRAIVVLAGVLAGFLSILVFYLVSQKLILAPVRELKACAERIAGGDMSARADLSTGDEFEELSDSFNDMLGQLERSRVELETINRSLDAKLGEMAQTNVALYESNKLKSEFLANVSHELRTPLTSIIGFADLLRDAAAGDSQTDKARLARYAHNILTSGRGLLDIINDLLDLAKIEAGRIELHRTQFSLRDLSEGLYDLTRPLFDKKEITFEVELPEELPILHSDAGKLRQILYNLLSNASKYTPEGGKVRFVVENFAVGQDGSPIPAKACVRLSVADTGPGIAPEHHERIFEKFRQLDSSVTREHSGTGLGLAITRELSLMLGGNIRLESEVGRGSTFVVEIPVECPEVVNRPLPVLS